MSGDLVIGSFDLDRLSADFKRFLPLIAPVGLAVLAHLPALPEAARVLDVACGTGEPGLSLARREPAVHLLGVDAAPGMVKLARAKAAREGMSNACFEVMAAENLVGCADASMDAVLSRFGLLMFGDVETSACELARVLRPGGHFSVAAWDDIALNTFFDAVLVALRPRVPAELLGTFASLNDWAGEGRREGLLRKVGLREVRSEWFRWHYEFPSQEAWWQFVSGPGMFSPFFAGLGEVAKEEVRSEVATSLAAFWQADNSYRIPHTCRLFWGSR